jgi:pseudouridylate synthase
VKEAEEKKVEGSAITPFILKKVHDLTEGASVKSNVSLIINNAALAAKIATGLYMGEQF